MVSPLMVGFIIGSIIFALWLVYSVVSTARKFEKESKNQRLHEDKGRKVLKKLKRMGM